MDNFIYKKLIDHLQLTYDECFSLAICISKKLNGQDEMIRQEGRDILILLLDNLKNIPKNFMQILSDLISAAGFYPYLKKLNNFEIEKHDFDDQIRIEYHASAQLENKYFHIEQKKIADIIYSKKNIIVSAPTSFGKSMLIEEIVASKIYKNIVIIQPTLALLDETRRKLKKYSTDYKIIVRTSQNFDSIRGNIFLLTAERVLEYTDMPPIQLLILDEFYKLSNDRGDNRSNILNTAFVRIMKNPECKFYMLGPNIDAIPEGFTKKYDAIFYKSNFSMVKTDTEDKFENVQKKKGGKIKEEDLFNILDNLNKSTLIYCASPKTARNLAFKYCQYLVDLGIKGINQLPLIDWIKDNLTYHWSLAKYLKYGIAVHDGSMPKHITASTIYYFNKSKIKFMFCTNTIIEGVNTSAKNVVYYDNTIGGKRKIDFFDYANIKGRAGRLMEHYIGKIINLQKPPIEQKTKVDFPFFVQDPIDSEVLVNLDEQDVKNKNDNIYRFQEFYKKDPELQMLLKRNAVSIEGQEKILSSLMQDLMNPEKKQRILWNQIDEHLNKNLKYLFTLCLENIAIESEKPSSLDWIINKIVGICYNKSSINKIIDNEIEYQGKQLASKKSSSFISISKSFEVYPDEMQKIVDESIEKIFAFQRTWLQYRAPKWITIVDSLQKYATKQLGNPLSGDYLYVAEMIENEFIQSNFRILLEYGLPHSAIEKLQKIFLNDKRIDIKNLSEEELINFILSKKIFLEHYLSEYEMEILNRVL